jgi:hypothetical protein
MNHLFTWCHLCEQSCSFKQQLPFSHYSVHQQVVCKGKTKWSWGTLDVMEAFYVATSCRLMGTTVSNNYWQQEALKPLSGKTYDAISIAFAHIWHIYFAAHLSNTSTVCALTSLNHHIRERHLRILIITQVWTSCLAYMPYVKSTSLQTHSSRCLHTVLSVQRHSTRIAIMCYDGIRCTCNSSVPMVSCWDHGLENWHLVWGALS